MAGLLLEDTGREPTVLETKVGVRQLQARGWDATRKDSRVGPADALILHLWPPEQ